MYLCVRSVVAATAGGATAPLAMTSTNASPTTEAAILELLALILMALSNANATLDIREMGK